MKIVILANADRVNQIFKKKHMEKLGSFGHLVVNREYEGPGPEKASELIEGAEIAITSWNCPQLTKEILKKAPDLKLVVHAAGSVKGIVSEDFWKRGIKLTSAAAALGKGVAETALGLTITSLKNVWRLNEFTHNGGWNEENDIVREMYDVTIGVVGAGFAGRHYIKLMNNFDPEILLYDPTVDNSECSCMGVNKVGLSELMRRSDVVSIHAPSIPATYHMINKKNLKLMKDRAVLINTARGTIIDEKALIKELKTGRISACIDVVDNEPPLLSNELRKLSNVILTPHIAGSVNNGKKRIGDLAVAEISRFLSGEKLVYEIFQEKLTVMA